MKDRRPGDFETTEKPLQLISLPIGGEQPGTLAQILDSIMEIADIAKILPTMAKTTDGVTGIIINGHQGKL